MAMVVDGCVEDEIFRAEGEMLVRRFTDSLNGETALEQVTVAAQRDDDRLEQDGHDMRMRALYEDRRVDSQ